jgi:hypothetical protein
VFRQSCSLRCFIAGLTASSMLLADIAPLYAQATPPAQPNRTPTVTIQECRNLADGDVRNRIKELTEGVLTREISQVDYATLVDKHWREARLSERIDVEVDEAIRLTRAETNVLDRAYSTISRETAEKTAIAVAERTFGSDGFKTAITELAQGVARDFGTQIEGASSRVAGPVIGCVQSALQSRYGGAVAQSFVHETEANFKVTPETGGARIGTSDLLVEGAGAIAGVVLIVSRRIVAQMVTTIGRRIAGLIASRIISTFTGLIGLALLIRDIYEANEGVFPLISERMKSDEAKDMMKEEITKSISSDLNQQLGTIAEETADRIYSFWLDFKQKYSTLLTLAEKSVAFADFLKNRKIEQLGRLGEIVALILGQEGEPALFKRVEDGSLSRALLDLDENGVAIAVETKSLDTAIAWARLAGRRIQRVVDLGLARIISPRDITEKQLATLLDIDDRNAAIRVAGLERSARDAILALPGQSAKELARRLTQDQLSALAVYYTRLQPTAANRLMRAIGETPQVMERLSSASIQNSILRSQDQLGALNVLLRDNTVLSIGNIINDLTLVRDGQIHYRVFLERYWIAIAIMLIFALLVLVWLRRTFLGRPQVVVVKSEGGGGRG